MLESIKRDLPKILKYNFKNTHNDIYVYALGISKVELYENNIDIYSNELTPDLFYIGLTDHPIKRLWQHLNSKEYSKKSIFINYKISRGNFIFMRILNVITSYEKLLNEKIYVEKLIELIGEDQCANTIHNPLKGGITHMGVIDFLEKSESEQEILINIGKRKREEYDGLLSTK